jgi:AcrR family transcriptional regulator
MVATLVKEIHVADDMEIDDPVGKRRNPVQGRAKDRVGRILAATEALLIEVGLRDLKVNHIARKAGVPIGSIYQYFPNREAILRALVDEHHAAYTAGLEEMVQNVNDFPALIAVSMQAFDQLAASYRGDSAFRLLWSSTQGFEPLRALDIEDTMRNAAVLCGALRRVMPGIPADRAMSACVLLCDIAGSVTRLSTELETDAERRLEQEAKVMVTDYLTNLFRSQLGK